MSRAYIKNGGEQKFAGGPAQDAGVSTSIVPPYHIPYNVFIKAVGWNLLLAAIPVLLGYGLERMIRQDMAVGRKSPGWLYAPWTILWIIFLPNTCYLVTEWRHFLGHGDRQGLFHFAELNQPQALLAMGQLGVFFILYTGVGLALFALAIRPIDRLLKDLGWQPSQWKLPLFTLMSLGVYLGLIMRFNSWDLLFKFKYVLYKALEIPKNPTLFISLLVFAGFLWLIYEAVQLAFDGWEARKRRVQQSTSQHPHPETIGQPAQP